MPLFALLAATFLADLPARRVALVALAWVYSAALTFSQVSRFSVDQQWQVADAVERASENADAPFVAAPGYYAAWMGLEVPFKFFGLTLRMEEPGEWLEAEPDYFVLPDIGSNSVHSRGLARFEEEFDGLRSGRAGYDLLGTYRSDFFSSRLYTSVDPALGNSFTQGEIGFELCGRSDRPRPAGERRP